MDMPVSILSYIDLIMSSVKHITQILLTPWKNPRLLL